MSKFQSFAKLLCTISFLGLLLLTLGCGNPVKDDLAQFSTLDALLAGMYDGVWPLTEIKRQGDTGIGTFHGLNGEMIMVNGHIYRIDSKGVISEPPLTEKSPYATISFFKADQTLSLSPGTRWADMPDIVDAQLPTLNQFYLIRIEGTFQYMKTRSVPKQQKPYPSVAEVVRSQPIFERENIRGILVGVRCPVFAKGVNLPGYHLHFLADDHSMGGHVIDFISSEATVQLDRKAAFSLVLPDHDDFYKHSFVEQNQQAVEAFRSQSKP
jgi:acetolactate decarboxylase